jgi:hypothetical protein
VRRRELELYPGPRGRGDREYGPGGWEGRNTDYN